MLLSFLYDLTVIGINIASSFIVIIVTATGCEGECTCYQHHGKGRKRIESLHCCVAFVELMFMAITAYYFRYEGKEKKIIIIGTIKKPFLNLERQHIFLSLLSLRKM